MKKLFFDKKNTISVITLLTEMPEQLKSWLMSDWPKADQDWVAQCTSPKKRTTMPM